jgi:biotin carboxyl carrier protein
MKLNAEIADRKYAVNVHEGQRVFVDIDDRRYEVDSQESGSNGYLLISSGQVFDCRVEGRPESGKLIDVIVGTSSYAVTLTDPKRPGSLESVRAPGDDAARIIAPMPGKVVRVLVAVGDQVEAGAGIIVVEAMKMQNEMKSPKAGTVVALNIQTGATVNGGDVLAVIE